MSLESGITYQASLPLSWRDTPVPDDATLALARHANLTLLHALAVLESVTEKDHDVDPVMSKAVIRLEAKLDIALSLITRLISGQLALPASFALTMGVDRIEWRGAEQIPGPGTLILLSLYLSPRLPEPLQLYARVGAAQNDGCVAEFLDHDEEHEEWITRTLFRYHRRALQARHQPG